MEIIAINDCRQHRRDMRFSFTFNVIRAVVCASVPLIYLYLLCTIRLLPPGVFCLFVIAGCFFFYLSLWAIDICMRWRRAVETISVQGKNLVIECQGGIFRRKKIIPLSTIRRVGIRRWFYVYEVPETLRVYYSGWRFYDFGLCVENPDALAKKIMNLL